MVIMGRIIIKSNLSLKTLLPHTALLLPKKTNKKKQTHTFTNSSSETLCTNCRLCTFTQGYSVSYHDSSLKQDTHWSLVTR